MSWHLNLDKGKQEGGGHISNRGKHCHLTFLVNREKASEAGGKEKVVYGELGGRLGSNHVRRYRPLSSSNQLLEKACVSLGPSGEISRR